MCSSDLSAHVHGATVHTIPKYVGAHGFVSADSLCSEISKLQMTTVEYLEDVLLSLFAHDWMALPQGVRDRVNVRLNASDLKRVCT